MRHFEKQIEEKGLSSIPDIHMLIDFEKRLCEKKKPILPIGILQRIFRNLLSKECKYPDRSDISLIYYKRFIANKLAKNYSNNQQLLNLLNHGFSWKQSPEGQDFWYEVYYFISRVTRTRNFHREYDKDLLWPNSEIVEPTPDPQDRAIARSMVIL